MGDVAAELGLRPDEVEAHGRHRAKIALEAIDRAPAGRGRLVLVTAITPTAHGVGKTVTAIGLAMALRRAGARAAVALRQSSLGPTLGLKGGGAGGGASTIVPLEECLLGMGADLFAVESATNLLAAVVEEGVRRGRLDPGTVGWRRVLDMDDRSLRQVMVGLGGRANGVPRETGFDITAASEVMAVLALSRDLGDLRARLDAIVPAWDQAGRPITAGQLGAAGAMAALLRDGLRPNLMQTVDGTPALIHTGPFANVAPGCSSVIADRIALPRVDFLVTEAGFGADLGAEKFIHLKCPASGVYPDVAVLVATVSALREHGGGAATVADADAVAAGSANLVRHVEILRAFGLPVVVALNRFPDDRDDELEVASQAALAAGAGAVAQHHAFTEAADGCLELARAVADASARPGTVHGLYEPADPVEEKVRILAAGVYGAADVAWDPDARAQLEQLTEAGFGELPVCMAKTHLSLSHDPKRRGAPAGYTLPVRGLRLAAGAGYLTVMAGDIVTMPGLPSRPRLLDIDLDDNGRITGLA
jgi:formate--tetrahydrofolate ligase